MYAFIKYELADISTVRAWLPVCSDCPRRISLNKINESVYHNHAGIAGKILA
jgi:hypothetical protein